MTQKNDNITLIQHGDAPQAVPSNSVEVKVYNSVWGTPGLLLARKRLGDLDHVVAIGERLEGARYAVFVVVDDDPDDLLDAIFGAEQEVISEVPSIPFDLRVRSTRDGWSPEALLATCFRQYRRP